MNAGPLLYDEVMELDLGIVYSCPPEEAVPHILAYFQQEFSNPFPAPNLFRMKKNFSWNK